MRLSPRNNEPIAGHSSEWMILRDMLSAGIAIYDEYPDMYNHVIKMMFKDYLPVRNYIYSGHNYHQGTSYVNVRFSNDLFSLWILQRMGAGAIYNPAQQFVLYDFLYRRRPDGQVMPAGDTNPIRKNIPSYSLPAMLASSFYKDSYLAYEYERKPNIERHCLIFDILWRDLDLKAKAPDDLPLTRYSGSPFGWMIARTAWDENSVIAEMKINEQFVGNHQHLDGGSFQLYYKGPLAIDAGAYQEVPADTTARTTRISSNVPSRIIRCWYIIPMKNSPAGTMAEAARPNLQPMTADNACPATAGKPAARSSNC